MTPPELLRADADFLRELAHRETDFERRVRFVRIADEIDELARQREGAKKA